MRFAFWTCCQNGASISSHVKVNILSGGSLRDLAIQTQKLLFDTPCARHASSTTLWLVRNSQIETAISEVNLDMATYPLNSAMVASTTGARWHGNRIKLLSRSLTDFERSTSPLLPSTAPRLTGFRFRNLLITSPALPQRGGAWFTRRSEDCNRFGSLRPDTASAFGGRRLPRT